MVPNLSNKYITVNTQMSTCTNDAILQNKKKNVNIAILKVRVFALKYILIIKIIKTIQ